MATKTRHFMRPLALLVLAAVAASVMMVVLASPAQAAIITVNSLADDTDGTDGECTLREAITAANTDTASGTSTGECAAGSGDDVINVEVPGTVNLTGALPDLSSNIELVGPGADQFAVRRGTDGDYRIFTVTGATTDVSISGITIANGETRGDGGGIYNDGGTLTITSSTISDNQGTRGGGVGNRGGTLTIARSTVSGNTAPDAGGGVYSFTNLPGQTTITNSTISGNTATNEGGGIYNFVGDTVIEFSTITNNTGRADNRGSGVYSFPGSSTRTEVLSSIISANTNTDVDSGDTTNSFVSKGYNLIGDGNATSAFNQTGDQTAVPDPGLGALADNGGPTNTHALLTGSPAIDEGPASAACPPPATDQRGVQRPQDGDADSTAICDIGSFELEVEEPENQAPSVRVARGGVCGPASDMRGTIRLSLSDPDTQPEELTLSATSSDRTVVPQKNIVFGGSNDGSRTLTVTAVKGSGTSTLRVRASDGDLQSPPLLVVVVSGTSANDALSGTTNADIIFARKGADALGGRGANDLLCGGNGKDALTGGAGADHFSGGYGTTDTATDFEAGEGDTRRGVENF